MTDPRPSENDRLEFPMAKQLGLIPPTTPVAAVTENILADLVKQLAETNRHLEAIAHELRLKNRVVGLS